MSSSGVSERIQTVCFTVCLSFGAGFHVCRTKETNQRQKQNWGKNVVEHSFYFRDITPTSQSNSEKKFSKKPMTPTRIRAAQILHRTKKLSPSVCSGISVTPAKTRERVRKRVYRMKKSIDQSLQKNTSCRSPSEMSKTKKKLALSYASPNTKVVIKGQTIMTNQEANKNRVTAILQEVFKIVKDKSLKRFSVAKSRIEGLKEKWGTSVSGLERMCNVKEHFFHDLMQI